MPTGTPLPPRFVPGGISPGSVPLRFGLRAGLTDSVRGLALAAVALAGFAPLAVILAAAGLIALGAGLLIAGNGDPPGQRVLLAVLVTGAGQPGLVRDPQHAPRACAG